MISLLTSTAPLALSIHTSPHNLQSVMRMGTEQARGGDDEWLPSAPALTWDNMPSIATALSGSTHGVDAVAVVVTGESQGPVQHKDGHP